MILNDNSLGIICNSKNYRDFQIKHSLKTIQVNSTIKKLINIKVDFHNEVGFRTLVLSEQSIKNLEHYRVPKNIRTDILKTLPNRKDIVQVGHDYCIKYVKTDDRLTVICLNKGTLDGREDGTFTFFFSIDLLTGHLVSDNYDYITKENIETVEQVVEQYYSKFMVIVTYLELTEVELKVVTSKGKSSTVFGSHILYNNSKKSVIHVTSDWNVEKIIVGTFGVRGHMRCIPTDRTRTKYRFIQIRPYTKNLIMKKPQKELVS